MRYIFKYIFFATGGTMIKGKIRDIIHRKMKGEVVNLGDSVNIEYEGLANDAGSVSVARDYSSKFRTPTMISKLGVAAKPMMSEPVKQHVVSEEKSILMKRPTMIRKIIGG